MFRISEYVYQKNTILHRAHGHTSSSYSVSRKLPNARRPSIQKDILLSVPIIREYTVFGRCEWPIPCHNRGIHSRKIFSSHLAPLTLYFLNIVPSCMLIIKISHVELNLVTTIQITNILPWSPQNILMLVNDKLTNPMKCDFFCFNFTLFDRKFVSQFMLVSMSRNTFLSAQNAPQSSAVGTSPRTPLGI